MSCRFDLQRSPCAFVHCTNTPALLIVTPQLVNAQALPCICVSTLSPLELCFQLEAKDLLTARSFGTPDSNKLNGSPSVQNRGGIPLLNPGLCQAPPLSLSCIYQAVFCGLSKACCFQKANCILLPLRGLWWQSLPNKSCADTSFVLHIWHLAFSTQYHRMSFCGYHKNLPPGPQC